MKMCRAGNHQFGCYCFMDREQAKYPVTTQVTHAPQGYKEPSYGHGEVVDHVPAGYLVILFDSGERQIVSPFAVTNNNKRKV